MLIRLLACVFCLIPALLGASPIRIKDLVEFDGVRGNDLVGYGLVVGLNGTGDGIRNAPFTEEIMSNILGCIPSAYVVDISRKDCEMIRGFFGE